MLLTRSHPETLLYAAMEKSGPGRVLTEQKRHADRWKVLLAIPAIGILVSIPIYVALGTAFALYGTTIFHSFGDGFSLSNHNITTHVIIRNDALIVLPLVELPYSYGVEVLEGNATCQLRTAEGIKSCGSAEIGLGTIKQGKSEAGPVDVYPNHGNFTLKYTAYVSMLSFQLAAAQVTVSCSTTNGFRYGCLRAGEPTAPLPLPPLMPTGMFLLLSLLAILATLAGLVRVILSRRWRW